MNARLFHHSRERTRSWEGKRFVGVRPAPRTENQLRRLSYALAHGVAAGLVQIRARQSVIVVLAQTLSMRTYYPVEEPSRAKPVDMYMLKGYHFLPNHISSGSS
jgi:hypothetical protein